MFRAVSAFHARNVSSLFIPSVLKEEKNFLLIVSVCEKYICTSLFKSQNIKVTLHGNIRPFRCQIGEVFIQSTINGHCIFNQRGFPSFNLQSSTCKASSQSYWSIQKRQELPLPFVSIGKKYLILWNHNPVCLSHHHQCRPYWHRVHLYQTLFFCRLERSETESYCCLCSQLHLSTRGLDTGSFLNVTRLLFMWRHDYKAFSQMRHSDILTDQQWLHWLVMNRGNQSQKSNWNWRKWEQPPDLR